MDGRRSVVVRKSVPVGPRLKEELFSKETVKRREV